MRQRPAASVDVKFYNWRAMVALSILLVTSILAAVPPPIQPVPVRANTPFVPSYATGPRTNDVRSWIALPEHRTYWPSSWIRANPPAPVPRPGGRTWAPSTWVAPAAERSWWPQTWITDRIAPKPAPKGMFSWMWPEPRPIAPLVQAAPAQKSTVRRVAEAGAIAGAIAIPGAALALAISNDTIEKEKRHKEAVQAVRTELMAARAPANVIAAEANPFEVDATNPPK